MVRKTWTTLLFAFDFILLTGFNLHGPVKVSPTQEDTDPVGCQLGVYLMSLHNLDFNNNTFTADCGYGANAQPLNIHHSKRWNFPMQTGSPFWKSIPPHFMMGHKWHRVRLRVNFAFSGT